MVAVGPGLGLVVRGGEDCLTLGLKRCPLSVFTITGLEKEERRRGWEEERFQEGMTGREGGGGLNRLLRAAEGLSPIKIINVGG